MSSTLPTVVVLGAFFMSSALVFENFINGFAL
jgi:hypothetical protein